jgi:hypothetical protein
MFDPAVVRERSASVNVPPIDARTRRRRKTPKSRVVGADERLEYESDG